MTTTPFDRVFLERCARGLLVFYPASFRERHGEEVIEAFSDWCEESFALGGRRLLWWRGLRALVNLVEEGLREQVLLRRRAKRTLCAGSRSTDRIGAFWEDWRHACRTLRRRPAVALAAILTMALGIGANSALFSVAKGVLFEPLPFEEPERLVLIQSRRDGRIRSTTSYPNFEDLRAQSRAFVTMATTTGWAATLQTEEPTRIAGAYVTESFFDLLGLAPARGRLFVFGEEASSELVMSYETWRERFGAREDLVGEVVRLDGAALTIVGIHLARVMDEVVGEARSAILFLLASVVVLLLMASVNVANLLLGEAIERERETAIRTALGGGRWRIARQLLSESVVLASLGGALGVALAYVGTGALVALGGSRIPRSGSIRVDAEVLLFACGISVLSGLLFGSFPVLQTVRGIVVSDLQHSNRSTPATVATVSWRQALVVGQVALSLVLLVSAGLLLKSFWNLRQVDSGIVASRLLTMSLAPSQALYPGPAQLAQLYAGLTKELSAIPEVEDAAASWSLPIEGWGNCNDFARDDLPPRAAGDKECVQVRSVSANYFRVMGIPLLRGRGFEASDDSGGPRVVVINQSMAETFFASEDPLGKFVTMHGTSREIVGVVSDVRHFGLARDPEPTYYNVHPQTPVEWMQRFMYLVIRTSGDPESVVSAVRERIWSLDATMPISRVRTMDELVSADVAGPRFHAFLLALFAAFSIVLVVTGLAGTMAFNVSQRIHEVGVRMALGARRRQVLILIVGQRLRMILVGIGLGLSGAILATRAMPSLLFGVAPTDGATFDAVPVLMMLAGLVAVYLPARRAARTDPARSLRHS